MVRKLLILTASLLAIGAGTAVAAVAPTWNSGYNNWWPGGFGYSPVTVSAPAYPASVTAYGLPNGHAGCSLNHTCSQTITITAISRPLAP